MQTLNQFIATWNGKSISLLQPGKQCFDLIAAWTDNLGVPHFPGNPTPFPYPFAYEIYSLFGSWQAQYFDRIENGLTNSPKEGDIVVWKAGFGSQGHTAIATGNSGILTFEAFSQNSPVGTPCQIKNFSYGYFSDSGIYGWLHPKNLNLTCEQRETLVKDALNQSGTTDTQKVQNARKILGI